MSKRAQPSPSTSKPKRTKVASDQSSLETFFGSSPRLNTSPANSRVGKGEINVELNAKKIATPDVIDLTSDSEPEPRSDAPPQVDLRGLTSGVVQHSPQTPSWRPVLMKNDVAALPNYQPLGVDLFVYDVQENPWLANEPAPYSFLVHALVTLSGTRSRIIILNTLTNTLRTLLNWHRPSLLPSLYLLSNCLSPPYSPVELGIGSSIISKAIQHISGLSSAALRRLYNSSGDPGDVAFEAKSNVRTLVPHPPLFIVAVYESLLKIANSKGQGAAKQKQDFVEKLLVAAKGEESRYLVRTLSQNLRVGAVRTSILTALARALVLTLQPSLGGPVRDYSSYHATSQSISSVQPLAAEGKKVFDPARDELHEKFIQAEALVKKVFVQHPNYEHIVAGLFNGGLDSLEEHVPLTVGIPLHPTLGSPTRSLDEIYDRLGDLPFAAEFKYDGQRAQIHGVRGGNNGNPSVHIFSRHLEDMTTKYPDIVHLVKCIFKDQPRLQSFIIDSEIVAIDPADGGLKSFQELSNRARKDVEMSDIKVSVCVYAFDLMYLDGEVLLARPFRERRSLLRSRFPPFLPSDKGAGRFDHVESCESDAGRDAIEEFWQKAIESRSEGLMIKLLSSGTMEEDGTQKGNGKRKQLSATYEPDKRTFAWLKLKKDYVVGLGDTLDMVPIGAWHGNGRKAGWWSPVLLAIRDPSNDCLVAVCKCMSGFSDAFYKEMVAHYSEGSDNCSRQPLWETNTGGFRPDVYFRPHKVWEIRGADITLSPVSLAALGLVSSLRGLSLRFPRFIKAREDKSLEQASTTDFLAQMWKDQQGNSKATVGDADDYDLMDVEVGPEEIAGGVEELVDFEP
ncbi:ATP-dependent DNA ligase [Suillus clintonianus]|uniref:ATP-dependent DNA ligase n=1 Tax=Suillus clintonianus TaxID=1904413 RepID=UPI001B8671D7|nr:ATP-dependent DNA ligase [Suillus clintonianus]KAG2150519.1 ATP-dependent DNA ligase [Suillus clintonianus]